MPRTRALQRVRGPAAGSAAASGRGRPATEYRLTDGWVLSSSDFLGLAGLLAAALVRAGPDAGALRAAAADWGRDVARRRRRRDVAMALRRDLEQLGFHANVEGDRVRMSGCPCAVVSPEHPEVVCTLASGLVDGVLEAVGSPSVVVEHDRRPERRRCTLRLGPASAAAPSEGSVDISG